MPQSVVADKPATGQPVGMNARPVNVFLMSNSLEVGGSERQFVALVESLNRERFQVHPACIRRRGPLVQRVGEIPEFPVGGSLFRMQSQRARRAMARSMRADRVLVAHAFDFYSNMMLIPAARWAGVPAVIGSHRQIGDLMTRGQFKAQRFIFRFCDRVVCNSRAAAESLLQAGLPERRIAIVPNGLLPAAFAAVEPAIPKKAGVIRIGMVARMNDPIKNHAAFLRAGARLLKKVSNVEFMLVGDGPLRPGLERLASQLQIGDRVIFAGETQEVPAMLASMDISVLISGSESLSNVILEAMAAGLPVVATSVGGNPELVKQGETGILIPPGDEAELVSALEQLISSPDLRAALSKSAKAFALANFHMDNVCRLYEQLYFEILTEKNIKTQGLSC